MEKIKRVWNVICAPMAFFLGAMWMLVGETGTGCLFIMFGANEVINRDQYELDRNFRMVSDPCNNYIFYTQRGTKDKIDKRDSMYCLDSVRNNLKTKPVNSGEWNCIDIEWNLFF